MVPSDRAVSSAPAVAPNVVKAVRRLGGGDDAFGVRDQDGAAAAATALDRLGHDLPGAVAQVLRLRRLAVEPARQVVGEQLDLVDGARGRLAAMVEHLHAGADRHGEQKRDDQQRNRSPQCRLGNEQPPVGRLSERLSQALDRIRIRRRARNLSRRHRCAPEAKFWRVGCRPSHPESPV